MFGIFQQISIWKAIFKKKKKKCFFFLYSDTEISTSETLANTKLSSFIRIYILTGFNEGRVHISFLAWFVTSFFTTFTPKSKAKKWLSQGFWQPNVDSMWKYTSLTK